MRTCTFCLSNNEDDAPYCAFCGRAGPPPPGAPTPGPQAPPPGYPPAGFAPGGSSPLSYPPSSYPPGSYAPTPAHAAATETATNRGPLVLVVASAVAALLLVLAAYLGSIAPGAPGRLEQERVTIAPATSEDGAHGR